MLGKILFPVSSAHIPPDQQEHGNQENLGEYRTQHDDEHDKEEKSESEEDFHALHQKAGKAGAENRVGNMLTGGSILRL